MTKLSVNVNKIATLRNARGGNTPNVLDLSLQIEGWGADGITVHPRPDERHIRYQDVRDLKPRLRTEFNIEGNPIPEFMSLIEEVRPAQATLVPDGPTQLTSDSGWDVAAHADFLRETIAQLHAWGVRASIFVGTDLDNIRLAREVGADRIELYTEPYASIYAEDKAAAVAPFVRAAELARTLGLGINAGHDLSLENISYLHECIPYLDEVSIGHALISEALVLGLPETIRRYQVGLGNLSDK
ncbi:MAG: pyridoxine 5'-phosphate synthase [Porphyromonas sp.]|nr:pyridoxine 5'-phosphate synthase [Porphyromonas sp.]